MVGSGPPAAVKLKSLYLKNWHCVVPIVCPPAPTSNSFLFLLYIIYVVFSNSTHHILHSNERPTCDYIGSLNWTIGKEQKNKKNKQANIFRHYVLKCLKFVKPYFETTRYEDAL